MRKCTAAFLVALALALALAPSPVFAGDTGGDVSLTTTTWVGPSGHGYLEFQVTTPDGTTPIAKDSPYFVILSACDLVSGRGLVELWQKATAGGQDTRLSWAPVACGPGSPPVVGSTTTNGSLEGYLGVSVDPASGPADTDRTVSSAVATNYVNGANATLSGWVDPSSVQVTNWGVDFGDGARGTYTSGGALSLAVVHTYGAGSFEAQVAAHMRGTVYAAKANSSGAPYEVSAPFTLTLTNSAGTSGAPIEYIPPVVTVGSDPTVNPTPQEPKLPNVPRDSKALASFYWLRGLPCTVYAAPIVVSEGFMRSAGVRIGGARTVLSSYTFSTTVNDRNPSVRSPNGSYAGNAPIEIQWNTPLGNNQPYNLSYTYQLVTTYDDGTVRNYAVSGGVGVVIVYSVMG
jgi:hypothetical protein